MRVKPTWHFNIMILGDSAVGKTCLLHRYKEDEYNITATLTRGVDDTLHLLEVEPGVSVKPHIWDTGGARRFRHLIPWYLRGAFGHLLVFDLPDRRSFEHIRDEWYPLVPEGSQCVLVGHKSDAKKRAVSGEEAEKLAQELGMPYMEASAATGHNVKEVFETLVRQIYKEKQQQREEQLYQEKQQEEEQRGEGSRAWCRLM